MKHPSDSSRRDRVAAVTAAAAARAPASLRAAIETFAGAYFHHLDDEDVAVRSDEDLLGALLSCWTFATTRAPDKPKMRVFSPSVAEDGWGSRHSVIEVINDDMPFLVDTMTMELNRQGLTLHLVVHPLLVVQREASGRLESLVLRQPGTGQTLVGRESWMHIEVDRLVDAQQRTELLAGLERVLHDVRVAVRDWQPMLARLRAATDELATLDGVLPKEPLEESRAFLRWLAEDHFTLLGYRCNDLVNEQGEDALRLVPGSGLGVLAETHGEATSASFAAVPSAARAQARASTPLLLVTRANSRSTVHRPGYTDYVGVKRYDAAGQVIGEHRFVGLFTSTAYSAGVTQIPLLRGKVRAVAERAALPAGA
jgi:glutamate dehydrogenase